MAAIKHEVVAVRLDRKMATALRRMARLHGWTPSQVIRDLIRAEAEKLWEAQTIREGCAACEAGEGWLMSAQPEPVVK